MPTNKNFTYKNEYYNSLNKSNTYYPERDIPPPQPPINNKHIRTMYSDETTNHTENIYPSPQMQPRGPNKSYYFKKEINETKNTYGQPRPPSPVNNNTTIYESNVSNTRNVFHPPGGIPVYPPANLPPHQPGTKQTYLYKKETTNTTNTVYEPPNGREYLPHDRYVTESPLQAAPPPEPLPLPPRDPTTNKYYKYSSTTTTTNTQRRPEREPLLTPFPTDGLHQPQTQVDGPPKHLNQLMESFNEVRIYVEFKHTQALLLCSAMNMNLNADLIEMIL